MITEQMIQEKLTKLNNLIDDIIEPTERIKLEMELFKLKLEINLFRIRRSILYNQLERKKI